MSVKYISALVVLLLSFVLLVGATGTSIASEAVLPAVPHSCPDVERSLYFTIVYGSVTIDGAPAPTGTVVEARNPRGDTVGCVLAQAGSYGTFYVYGEDKTVAPAIPGMREGEIVSFYIDGQLATASPSLVWSNDHQIHQVDLDLTDLALTPTPSITPTVSPPGTCPSVKDSLRFTVVYGDVVIDEAPAPIGTVVEARNPRGDTVGCVVMVQQGSYGTFYVYGEDTTVTPPIPGMREGEIITFYVNGHRAISSPPLAWINDHQVHQVNLEIGSSIPTPTAVPTESTPMTCPDVKNSLRLTVVYGNVFIRESPAPVGTIVEARNPHGDTVGCFRVTQIGSYGTLYVYGEDVAVTPLIPGMREGEEVAFYINGREAIASPTLVWINDREIHKVNLSVGDENIYLPLVIRKG